MGYQSAELQQYGLTAGACFVPVTGSTFDLTDLKVTGYEEATEGDVQIQTLDFAGRTVANYTYYDIPGEVTGWFDGDDNEVAEGDVVVKPGEGLWTYSLNDGFTFIFPGVTL